MDVWFLYRRWVIWSFVGICLEMEIQPLARMTIMREIILPPVHNKRSPAQWEIISKYVDFKGKTVLDLGCGYADLLWRCWRSGAKECVGIDNDEDIVAWNQNRQVGVMGADTATSNLVVFAKDIDYLVHWNLHLCLRRFDIILCFSVLPYLDDPVGVLGWIYSHSRVALLEVQYFGDGPGPIDLQNDRDMEYQLEMTGWESVTPIGTTYIPDRDKYRTIWMCKNQETQ